LLEALASIDLAHFQTMQLASLPFGLLLLRWPSLKVIIGVGGGCIGCSFKVWHSTQFAWFTTDEYHVGDVAKYVHQHEASTSAIGSARLVPLKQQQLPMAEDKEDDVDI
jgi:hypothetical protein